MSDIFEGDNITELGKEFFENQTPKLSLKKTKGTERKIVFKYNNYI